MRLSPSLAKILVQQGPKACYEAATRDRSIPYKRSSSMRFGAAVDRLVFGFGDELVVKTQRGQPELPGTILVTEKELERARSVALSISGTGCFGTLGKDKVVATGADAGLRVLPQTQQKLAWVDSELHIELVSKPDFLDGQLKVGSDLKTTWNISDYAITRDIELYGYDIQAAAYLDAMANCLGWDRPGFCFVFAKTSPAYDVIIRHLNMHELERGQQLWQGAKVTWKRCLETGEWPDKPDQTKTKTTKQQLTEWESK